jgi:hypothetical protein
MDPQVSLLTFYCQSPECLLLTLAFRIYISYILTNKVQYFFKKIYLVFNPKKKANIPLRMTNLKVVEGATYGSAP